MTTTGGGSGRGEAWEHARRQAHPASPRQREAARDHVARLRQDGGTYRTIAAAAAVSPAAVYGLASGRRRAQPGTAAVVLTVIGPTLPQARLDATGTRLRLRALHVMGHGSARIARATGVHPVTMGVRHECRGPASGQVMMAVWLLINYQMRSTHDRAVASGAGGRAGPAVCAARGGR
jgi:hypothetical protein